jgi:hypothetical protein
MKPRVNTLLSFALFFTVASFAFTQDTTSQPCPDLTAGTLGCELVAWSHLQEPVPLPEPDANLAPPAKQPGQSPNPQTQPQASRQSITGIIVRQGEKYVLNAGANTTYQLDDQDKAKRYLDKRVVVVGRLNTGNNTLRIESVELAS